MKILIATDGSKYSETAVKRSCDIFAGAGNPTFRVVSVAEHASPIVSEQIVVSNDLFSRLAAEARIASEEAVSRSKDLILSASDDDNPPIVETNILDGSPREAIVNEAADWEADVIIVGSHGYGFWDRMLLGSVSDAVIHHAPCSVMVVRPGK